MADFAGALRVVALMIAAEQAIQDKTNDQLDEWIPLFLAALIPAGTTAIHPDASRAEAVRPLFNEDAIVEAAMTEWRKRYASQRVDHGQSAEARFEAEVRRTIRLVPDRTYEVAKEVIRAGVKSGQSVEAILANVETAVKAAVELTAERTGGLIGPTAINDATLSAALDSEEIDGAGPYLKTWVNITDKQTRPTHLDAGADEANFRIPLRQKFQVGGEECDYPRQASLSPRESINCRCVAQTELA